MTAHHHELECHAKRLVCCIKFKVTARAHMIKMTVYILLRPNLIWWPVHYHKPEYFMRKLDCCIQGQVHSKTSKCQWMFVQTISSEPLHLLPPNLEWWCIIRSQSICQKDWFAVFNVKITAKDHTIKILLSNISSELLILLQPSLVWWHIIRSWIVSWKDWIALLWSRLRLQKRFKIPVNVRLHNISTTARPFESKLGMWCIIMSQSHARRLVCCLQRRGHSEGSYSQIWLFLPYLLNYWSFCNQI